MTRGDDEQDRLDSWRADLDGGVLEGFQEGLSETADEFFRDRAGWLVPPYGVRVVAGLTGGFDVAVCVDGTYADRADAEKAAAYVQAIIAGHVDRLNAKS